MSHRRLKLVALLSVMALLTAGAVTHAADPQFNRAVRIIVPYAPGGSSDILARLIGPHLSKAIGQPVVVENKVGASGNIGADFVAKAEKDGHTMLITDVGTMAAAPNLFSKLTFDVEKDLAPVTMVMFSSYVLGVHPSVPVNSIAEMVAYAKANPTKLSLATSGVGSVGHLTGYVLAKHWGINWKYVPYKGGAAAIRGVVANESNVIINGALATAPFAVQNQIKGLAVSGPKRLDILKSLPCFKELKLPAEDSGSWQGIVTTAGTPAPVIARLNAELKRIITMPDIKKKIEDLGGDVIAGTPVEFAAWMKENIAAWGAVVREANIKVE